MNTKNNQRYRDMDIFMKAALTELMKEKDFEKITVRSICERAGVNRGTFYSHYADIYAMLEDAEIPPSRNHRRNNALILFSCL